MDCPGAVSVSASNAVLSFSKSVVVDISETGALPATVKAEFQRGGAAVPIVIFTDPGLKNTYGRFSHAEMKKQNYGAIFSDARSAVSKAIKDGTFSFGEGNEPKIVKIEGTEIEAWTSSKGTEIKAKLVAIEDDKIFIFETAAGKTIRATAAQLSKESVAKAQKLAK